MSGFYESFYQLCRDKIPGFLFNEIKSAAIPASGAAARWRGPGATIFERIAIHDLAPDKLKKVESKELKNVLRRLNKIFQTAKRAKEDTTPFSKAASLVVREMRDRKMGIDSKLAILQSFIGKSDEEIAKNYAYEAYAVPMDNVPPTSTRGYTTEETLQLAKENGKFSPEDAYYNPRSPHGWKVCASCRFFVRNPDSSAGTCMAIEGTVNWFGTSDLYISAADEAAYVFSEAESAVRDELMDNAMEYLQKSGEMGTDDDNNTDPQKPKMVITAKEMVKKRIKHEGDEWIVTDDTGKGVLGRHANRADAVRQLAAIEARQAEKACDDVEKGNPTVAAVATEGTPGRAKDVEEDLKRLNSGNDDEEEIVVQKAETKTEDGKSFKSSDYAYVPDPQKPSTWKLRLTNTPGGEPDSGIVGAAIAALGKGFRGNKVQIPASDLSGVRAKVRAAWKKANPDKSPDEMSEVIKKEDVEFEVPIAKIDGELQKIYGVVLEPDMVDTQGDTMTAEEIEKAAETFMKSRVVGDKHQKIAKGVELTDSYVCQGATKIGNKTVKKGTWIIGVKVLDHGLWSRIKDGEYTGFSVGGRGNRVKMA